MKKLFTSILFFFSLFFCVDVSSQDNSDKVDHSYKPLKLSLNESGSKYVRFIVWHQQWLQTNNSKVENTKTQLTSFARRSRFLAFAQVSPRFLILTHFGLNNMTPGNMTSLGNNGDAPQIFLHDAWTEFKVSPNSDALYVGTGLHYWKGMTRLANQSTLNMMTLDAPRPFTNWHSLGITDQFARHFGVYAKGKMGKFDYRIAFNNPMNPANSIGAGKNYGSSFTDAKSSDLTYTGSNQPKSGKATGNMVMEGYFRVNLLDQESIKLPYQVGTYFGKKKVFGIGAGFFAHPDGMYNTVTEEHESVTHFAADVFYDAPLGSGAVNFYTAFQQFNYGENYVSRWAGTGSNFYVQAGYFVPSMKVMPYFAYQSGSYDALKDNISSLDIGLNYYVNGHNAKITLEYHSISGDYRDSPSTNGDVSQIRLQTHIFL